MEHVPIIYDFQAFTMQRFGGISRYFCEIISRVKSKRDIALRYSINYYLSICHIAAHRIPIPRFLYKHFKSYCTRKNIRLAERLLQTEKEYIFHPTYYNPYFLKHIGNHPYVVTVHDMIHERFPSVFTDAETMIQHKKEVITGASRIIAISKYTKNDIIDLLHIAPDKIDVIYHGTSMKPFTGKHKLNLPKRYLLYVGDRAPYKNFKRLSKVFSLLQKEDPELFLVYTGKSLKSSEKEYIEKLGILKKLICIKASDKELSELYNRALLFVYPSLYEGFGIPILEAFACNCPIALSRTSCFPEIAGDAASYFDPYSEESMLEAIKQVIYHPQKRKELIAAGNIRIELYSWEKAAKETEMVYQKVKSEYFKQ